MIAIDIKKVEAVILSLGQDLNDVRSRSEKRLQSLRENPEFNFNSAQIDYLESLLQKLTNVNELITAKPSKLIELRETFDPAIAISEVEKLELDKETNTYSSSNPEKWEKFSGLIQDKLDYGYLRDNLLRKSFHRLGLKVCVYCNANYALTLPKQGEESYQAMYEIDHYLPKEKYPCFSISIYNFYPACGACNRVKSTKLINFTLYAETDSQLEEAPFYFDFEVGKLPKKLLRPQAEELKFKFLPNPNFSTTIADGEDWVDYQSTFHIESTYNTQADIAEEICWKAKVYSREYLQSLKRTFPNIFSDSKLTKRIILGNYPCKEEIHKRPLAKFMQDIAKRVGLLDEE